MSDDKRQEAINRGKRAALLLQDDLLTGAFEELEASYIKALLETHVRDNDARERLYVAVHVARKVKDHLHKCLADGKIAQREIDDLNRPHLRAV